MTGKFEITKRKNGEFHFNLKAGNGQVILTSEGYTQITGCSNGIESVRKHSVDDKFFERKTSKDGSPYFTLNAGNGQVIGKSEMYTSKASCENGIASVMSHAADAKVVDKSAL